MKLLKNTVVVTSTIVTVVSFTTSALASSLSSNTDLEYLKSLDIEALLATEITSVSKKPEKLADAAAAVFVITSEDLERTGARSIPEALRMVPGLQVSQVSATRWTISARGFTDTFSNKLLVLMDGRSVYTPLFGGVFWEIQDTVIEDIDRIEVIRGPGATLWGANAVNGVINIITKSTLETGDVLVSAGTGTNDKVMVTARVGDRFGEDSGYRLFVKGNSYSGNVQSDGEDAHDAWESLRSGFRTDIGTSKSNSFTLQGDVFKGEEELTYSFPGVLAVEDSEDSIEYKGANLLGRWEGKYNESNSFTLQSYYDYTTFDALVPSENRHTFDVDFQHQIQFFESQEIVWGLGYRVSKDDVESTGLTRFDPDSDTQHLYSGFIQDEIMLVDKVWWLTLGSKLEHNDYSGFEIQPNIRTRWKPVENQVVWGAVSRAVRAPSRADQDLNTTSRGTVDSDGNRVVAKLLGNDNFDSEDLLAYEVGHRWSVAPNLSFDTAAFYNVYKELRSLDRGQPYVDIDSTSPYLAVPLYIGNNMSGETWGVEFLASWQPIPTWKLAVGYSYIGVALEAESSVILSEQQFQEDDFLEHQVQLRSYYNITDSLAFDSEIYYVDDIEGRDIDSYLRLDLRLAWQVNEQFNLSLNGENLLDEQHAEFGDSNSVVGTEVPRLFYAKLTWRY